MAALKGQPSYSSPGPTSVWGAKYPVKKNCPDVLFFILFCVCGTHDPSQGRLGGKNSLADLRGDKNADLRGDKD